jgi:hypothetical protein
MAAAGLHKTVDAVVPTVTNSNNVSICCGNAASTALPATITSTRQRGDDYMENADFLRGRRSATAAHTG